MPQGGGGVEQVLYDVFNDEVLVVAQQIDPLFHLWFGLDVPSAIQKFVYRAKDRHVIAGRAALNAFISREDVPLEGQVVLRFRAAASEDGDLGALRLRAPAQQTAFHASLYGREFGDALFDPDGFAVVGVAGAPAFGEAGGQEQSAAAFVGGAGVAQPG